MSRYWDADRLFCVSCGSYFSRGVPRYLARNCNSAALIYAGHRRGKTVPDETRSGATFAATDRVWRRANVAHLFRGEALRLCFEARGRRGKSFGSNPSFVRSRLRVNRAGDPSYIRNCAAMDDSMARLGVCAEIGRGLRREAGAGQPYVVGRISHSFTDNMPRREIQGVGSVESRAC